MRRITIMLLASSALFPGSACWAQKATAVGVGVGVSHSSANSAATAIGGGNASAQGGRSYSTANGGNPVASINIQNPQIPTATTTTVNNTGDSTVRNVPSVFAPGLAAAGLETCLGSVSGGGSFVGTGFSFGSTIPDPGCAARLDARTLWSMGLKKAAIARLCLGTEIYRAMPEVCVRYLPTPYGYGVEGVAAIAPVAYTGGPIMLTEGKTGQDRLCNDYDATRQRCRVWADAAERHAKRVASSNH